MTLRSILPAAALLALVPAVAAEPNLPLWEAGIGFGSQRRQREEQR
jgi:hypothetical protein